MSKVSGFVNVVRGYVGILSKFVRNSLFHECSSVEMLKERLSRGNWCLAQAFYWQDLCFINQVDGGDEWLVIKGDLVFESLTVEPMIASGRFDDFLRRVMTASREQLLTLQY